VADADKNLIFATGSQKSGRKESILEEKGRSAGPEGERGVSIPPSHPLDSPLPATKKGLLAPFNPEEAGSSRKYWRFTPVRREDLFTAFSASAGLKSLRDSFSDGRAFGKDDKASRPD
jgi:hypothetical protein